MEGPNPSETCHVRRFDRGSRSAARAPGGQERGTPTSTRVTTIRAEDEAYQRAASAAREGDAVKTCTELMHSSIMDGLWRRLVSQSWWRLDDHLASEVVGDALDELFNTMVKRRSPVDNVGGLLWTIVYRRAIDKVRQVQRRRKREGLLDERIEADADQTPEGRRHAFEEEADKQYRVRMAVHLARSLLPQLGMTQSQRVLETIFDALERGDDAVELDEIADALGSTREAVRRARDRGFARLERVAREAGITDKLEIPGMDADADAEAEEEGEA